MYTYTYTYCVYMYEDKPLVDMCLLDRNFRCDCPPQRCLAMLAATH